MTAHDYVSRDLEGAAHLAGLDEPRSEYRPRERRSVSGTSSCRGCSDPTCGYCEAIEERSREDRIEAERDKIKGSHRDLLDCLDRVFVDDMEHLIAEALELSLERDDLAACDRLREALRPRIDELAERRIRA